jgi:hypothetical protein
MKAKSKTEKLSFKNVKDALSRDEMKEIMAGSFGQCGICVTNNWGTMYCGNMWGSCVCPDRYATCFG